MAVYCKKKNSEGREKIMELRRVLAGMQETRPSGIPTWLPPNNAGISLSGCVWVGS